MTGNPPDQMTAAVAHHERGNLAEAEALYRAVLARAPERSEALQYLGVLMSQTGRAEAGVELMARAVAASPLDVDARFNLAHGLVGLGRVSDAIVQLRRGVTLDPKFLPGWMQLGALLYGERRFGDAAECFTQATELAPTDAQARYNLARARHAVGKFSEAAADYRVAVALDPGHVDALNNLGTVLGELGDYAAAIETYRGALARQPDAIGIRINLGAALRRANRLDEAIGAFEAVLAVDPDNREALQGVGAVLSDRGDHERAAKYFEKILAREPAHFGALLGLGLWHFTELRFDRAREMFERAVAVDPQSPDANAHYGTAIMMERGDVAAAISQFRRALDIKPDFAGARSNLLLALHYDTRATPAEIRRAHDAYESVHGAALRAQWRAHANSCDPDRRLRVGYVSPDFREHSCSYFVEPLLAAHDRAAFDVFCYANVQKPDSTTERLKALAVNWRDIHRRNDAEAADLIRDDRIDILVDLAGHTGGNRVLLLARKPAPIQATWLGYPDTIGLKAIDYRLTDAIADPPGSAEALSSETLVRLERGFLCYRPSPDAPDVAPLPARAERRITLGCFNNLAKVNDEVIAIWAAALAAVPGARLAIKDMRLRDRAIGAALVQKFMAHGIAQERITLLPPLASPREFLALYGGVDIALDPFPYNGTTTTCEALWMGVPVVTLRGDRHSCRVGASLLTQIGRGAWIAEDPGDYVRIVAGLAANLELLANERTTLRARVAASPLCDAPGFARAMESAYRSLWRTWCRGRAGRPS